MERMGGGDALMLYLDRAEAYNHTIKLQIIDPAADPAGWSWSRFKAAWASRIGLVPRLRQHYLRVPLGLNHPVWVDDPAFDLDYHLRRAEDLAAELGRATPQQLRGRKGVQLARLLQSYVRHTRDHMRREELVFYARSESVLERSDWNALSVADEPADPMSDLRKLAAEYPLLAARLTQPVREIGGTGIAAGTTRSGDLMRHILEDFSEAYGGLFHDAIDLVRANIDSLRSVRTPTGFMRAARPIHARNMQFLGRCVTQPTRWARQSAGAIVAAWGRPTR